MLVRITQFFALLLLPSLLIGAQETVQSMNVNAQLISAAKRNQLDLLARALNAGGSPNSRNRAGDTALNLEARNGNVAMVQLLLSAGGEVNKANLEK